MFILLRINVFFLLLSYPAAPQQPRDDPTKNRTRVAARAALFSSFSDDLRRVMGLETARSGLLMMFDMLQHPVLNKRLAIVLLVKKNPTQEQLRL